MESLEEDPSQLLLGVCIASAAFLVACLFLFKNKKCDHDNENNAAFTLDSSSTSVKGHILIDEQPSVEPRALRNVFSVKQTPTTMVVAGNGCTASSTTTAGGRLRPFESSYYFAHNGQSTGGGYKDGLRAEDYVMNGPRLLSKGGVRVMMDESNGTTTTNETDDGSRISFMPPQSNETNSSTIIDGSERKRMMVASTPITKYMWDDDDDGSGNGNIAKIHIDCLPLSSSNTKTMKWEDAGISSMNQIDVRLIGNNNEGLYIGITSHAAGKRRHHHLHVPKLYGEAESAKAILKRHKLIVKIRKKRMMRKRHSKNRTHSTSKGYDGIIWTTMTKSIGNLIGGVTNGDDEEEYTSQSSSWPRLSASLAGGLGGGSSEIDEKLFKEMSVEDERVDDF